MPGGVLQLIAEQIIYISNQGSETLGTAFIVGLLIALVSANSGMAALFDALNVVYDERENAALVRFYATTFLFTLAGIGFHNHCDHGSGRSAADAEVRRSGDEDGRASCDPAMAYTFRDHRSQPSLYLPLWSQPEGRSLALGIWGSILGAVIWMAASMIFSWYVATFDSYNRTTAPLVLASASWSGCGSRR